MTYSASSAHPNASETDESRSSTPLREARRGVIKRVYATKDAAADLKLLETLLLKNNYRPCYVDLTRKDIGLPVVKTIVSGMELLGDFDNYSRVHPELYHNYISLYENNSVGK